MSIRVCISEAKAEAMCDRIVRARLDKSAAYQYAESIEDQAEIEDRIEAEVWAELELDYDII